MAAMLAPLALGLGSAVVPHIGGLIGRGLSKLGDELGLKRGGSYNPKGMRKALQRATVKKTGVRTVKKNELVIPKGLATKLKAVARRKPQKVKKHKKKK